MHRASPFAIFLLLSTPVFLHGGDEWPMYLGDVRHSSFNPGQTQLNARNAANLGLLWRINVGSVISTGITISGGRAYFGDWDGRFYSVEASTGAIFWETFVGRSPDPADSGCQPGIGVAGQSVVSGDTVYTPGGDSSIYALDILTGAVRWRAPLADPQNGSQIWSSLMLSGNALYVGIASLGDCPTIRGGLARIDLANPLPPLIRYFVPDGETGAAVWSTPAIDEATNFVYVTTGNADSQDAAGSRWGSAMLALDKNTLEIKSYFFLPIRPGDVDADFGSSPSLFETPDGGQYVAASGKDGVMYVLRRPDLSPAWTYKLATDCIAPEQGCGSISTPAFDGKTLVTGAGQSDASAADPGSIYALDPATHNALWVYGAPGVVLAPVTLTPGLVFAATDRGLTVVDSSTGAELWNDGEHAGMYGQAAVTGGVVYAAYVNGDVAAWGVTAGSSPLLLSVPEALTFRYTAGGPAPAVQTADLYASNGSLSFTAVSNASWLSADPPGGASPATLNISAAPSGMAPGAYSGSVTVSAQGAGSIEIPVKLLVTGPQPAIDAANVVNAASSAAGAISPGGLFSIFGSGNLAAETGAAPGVPWPTLLNGVSVAFNGTLAPLFYVSPTQINGQAPFELEPGPVSLVVTSNGVASPPVSVNVAAAAPGIFLSGASNRAAAVNEDGTINAPDNPARAGGAISVYLTGQGQLDDLVQTGTAATDEYLCSTLAPTSATVGGEPAGILFSGLAPGFVGLAQVNLIVPDLPAGDYPVIVTIGDAPSNPGIVSVTPANP